LGLRRKPHRETRAGQRETLRPAPLDPMRRAIPKRIEQRQVAHDALAAHAVPTENNAGLARHDASGGPTPRQSPSECLGGRIPMNETGNTRGLRAARSEE